MYLTYMSAVWGFLLKLEKVASGYFGFSLLVSPLTYDGATAYSKDNGHTQASCLMPTLTPNGSVHKGTLKVKCVYQPIIGMDGERERQKEKLFRMCN